MSRMPIAGSASSGGRVVQRKCRSPARGRSTGSSRALRRSPTIEAVEAVKGYGLTLLWFVAFLALAWVAHFLFDRLTPFSLHQASGAKNRAVGHVLRGLYVGLALILLSAIRSNRSL